jgi:hypothetical protein
MMVLMVRGLFTSFTFPYASLPTSKLTGDQLIPIFYEAIRRVERCGFKVSCITLDGNSVNRKLIKPLSFGKREIYMFSDPPHLIKTARNCSFIDLIKFIFTIPNVKSFLSERISQDPLEKYFGHHHQRGGVNENPTSYEFLKNNSALRMVNSIRIETHKGNTIGEDNDIVTVSTESLKKKRKQSIIITNLHEHLTYTDDRGNEYELQPQPFHDSIDLLCK